MSDFLPRALVRHSISGAVDVYDAIRDLYIGRLVNIHTQGLMLIGDVPLKEDNLYQLDLHLPQEINGTLAIHVGVDCLWTRNTDKSSDKHWAGFAIIDLSPEAEKSILALIAYMGEKP